MRTKESMVFLKRFIGSLRQVGSVAPSSRFLTGAMLGRVDWKNAGAIAELEAGTGVFTREIVKRARPDAKILAKPRVLEARGPKRAETKVSAETHSLCKL